VARDEAFSFLYADNLDLLQAAGGQISFFSPLHDRALPEGTGAIYLCGGFPELYAAQLSANQPMLAALRSAAAAGMPIYAECGGLMYLTEAVVDAEGHTYPLVGLLTGRSVMTPRLTLGYRTVQAQGDSWLWRTGETVRGHEFHYSVWQQRPDATPWLYQRLPDAMRPTASPEGAQLGSVLASYIHLHFLAHPDLATRFVAAAQRTKGTNQ
jgi:cobyrinic acid a,c-diamide synthase